MNKVRNKKYTEISEAAITQKRSIVISDCSTGGYTLAQKVVVTDGESHVPLFLKGAFQVDNIDGLINLRDALNAAIHEIENRSEDLDWDEEE